MNKKLKSQLQAAFDAPAPVKKYEFIQSINFPKASRLDFVGGQLGYIRKRVWIVSSILVTSVLFGLRIFNNDNLDFVWMMSSMLPFVSLITITEIARSTSYNMEELEMSCKYNFADIVLTRLSILSCYNITVFALIIFLLRQEVNFGILRLGIYLLVPFMLTCALSLFVLNHLHSRETVYICCAISCFVCLLNALFSNQYKLYLSEQFLWIWGALFVFLGIWLIREVMNLIKKTGELKWNLL